MQYRERIRLLTAEERAEAAREKYLDFVALPCGRCCGTGGYEDKVCVPCQGTGRLLKYWTRERIIVCIKRWHRQRGRSPTSRDWDQRATAGGIEIRTDWPSTRTVQREFGTWNAALEAAGVPLNTGGRKKLQRCKRGHLYADTAYYWRGKRHCRACANVRRRK